MHVEPGGQSFVGGGLWHPDAQALARLRASIDERPRRWRRVLCDPLFRDTFLLPPPAVDMPAGHKKTGKTKTGKKKAAAGGDEKEEVEVDAEEAALRAFAEANKEGALKTRPKGFVPEHRDMQLLKLRNFTVGKKVPDGVFTALEGGQEQVAAIVRAMVGFVS